MRICDYFEGDIIIMNRIVFLKETDGAFRSCLEAVKCYIDEKKIYEDNLNINNIIDQYIIKLYIDQKIIDKYIGYFGDIKIEEISNIIKTNIGKFNSLYKNNILEQFTLLENCDKEYFWKFIEHNKLYKSITSEQFTVFLYDNKFYLNDLLKNKGIVKKFDEEIKDYMLSNVLTIEEFIRFHLIDNKNKEETKLHFPESLNIDVINKIIELYLNDENSNPNTIKLISECTKSEKIKLSDKIRLKAKKQYENYINHQNKYVGYETGYRFGYSQDMSIEYDEECKNQVTTVTISENWISENLDYNTLLNNFILFEFVNMFMIIPSGIKNEKKDPLINIFGSLKDKNAYEMNHYSNNRNKITKGTLSIYIILLNKYGIEIENIFEWFFKNYLKDEFNLESFNYNASSNNSSYLEKCKNICSEMENVFRQYNCCIEEGYIDHELIRISSSPIKIEKLKSKINNKYIYPNTDNALYSDITYLLFSNQSMLAHPKKFIEKYNNFYELLINEDVYKNDYENIYLNNIDYLINNGFIFVDENEILKCKDKVSVLYILYALDEISYWHLDDRALVFIDELYYDGLIYFKSSFFTKLEADYFDYHLNNSKFTNALAIRNYYSHGNIPDKDDIETHKNNYMELVKLLVMTIIKINDELCTYDEIARNKKIQKIYDERT